MISSRKKMESDIVPQQHRRRRRQHLMPQSRQLPSRTSVDVAWLRALFDFMDQSPRSAIYSMAFALTCVRTYDLTERSIDERPDRVAGFEAARELLDLLRDNIDDYASSSSSSSSSSFDTLAFARANDAYVSRFDDIFLPVARYAQAVVISAKSEHNDVTTAVAAAAVAVDARLGVLAGADDDAVRLLHRRNWYVVREVSGVLERASARATETGMRVPANSRCSVSVTKIDPLIRDDDSATAISTARLRDMLSRRIVNGDATTYTYLEAYIAYGPIVYRYESLNDLISHWNHSRRRPRRSTTTTTTIIEDDDESIQWILLPTRGVWQSGTSQILWLVMHTLAALTVQRNNRYVLRLMAILENFSYYVWCAECSFHWAANRGNDYFRHISSLPRLHKLPIDVILLRCHNTVNGNSSYYAVAMANPIVADRDGFVSQWTLANLCLDYRDFAAIGLLRRGDGTLARSYRATICRPLVTAMERIGFRRRSDSDDDDAILSTAFATADAIAATAHSVTAAVTMQTLLLDALKQQHGSMLLRKLWHDIDSSRNVPICAAMI